MDTNNGLLIIDPLSNSRGLTTKTLCLDATGGSTLQVCTYTYRLCDNGLGYAIGTRFESKSNISLYLDDSMTATTATSFTDAIQYEVGSCQTYDSDPRNLSCIMGNPCTTGGVISLTII